MTQAAKFPAALVRVLQDLGGDVLDMASIALADNPLTIGAVTVNLAANPITAGWPTQGWVTIDNEVIAYTGLTASSLTGCTRGAGTGAPANVPAAHVIGASVELDQVALRWNQLVAEVVALETFIGINGIGLVDRQVFTGSGTWTKPTGARHVLVIAFGAGCGGNGGSGQAAGTNRWGGMAGGAGSRVERRFDPSALGGTETVTIAAGSTGGPSDTNAVNPGNTTFGAHVTAFPGAFGQAVSAPGGGGGAAGIGISGNFSPNNDGGPPGGGKGGNAAPGNPATSGEGGGGGGGQGTAGGPAYGGGGGGGSGGVYAAGQNGGDSMIGAGGGGGGGGVTSGNAQNGAGNGGGHGFFATGNGGAGGAAGNNPGAAGTSRSGTGKGGDGGGGGGATHLGQGGVGGAGGAPGGGGGGGGAGNTGTAGAGGNGGRGEIIVYTWI